MKKPQVTFWLKKNGKKGSDKPALIMLNFSYHPERLRMSTGLSIKETNWYTKNAFPKASFGDYAEYKNKLLELEQKVLDCYSKYIEKGIIPTPDTIKKEVQSKAALVHESEIVSLHTYFTEFIEEKRLEVKGLTLKKYETLKNVLLKGYEESDKCTLSFDSMDLLFEKRFKYYLTETKEQRNNTVSKYMDCLKTFLKWAHKKGYHSQQFYQDFTSKRTKTKVIHLELNEFQSLLNLNLDDNPILRRVRDWFCFQCFTGQRFSDVQNMKWQDVVINSEGNQEWHLYQIKGNKPEMVEIPLIDGAISILNNLKKDKSSQRVFPKITNQEFNRYLKDACRLAGITSHVNYVTYCGKRAKDLSGPKYKFISSHIARKTFVTISKFHGKMSNEAIRAITGHSNDKMLNVYTGEDKRYVANEMQRVWGGI